MKRAPKYDDAVRLLTLVSAVVVIATLYFARVVFIPLALAMLFALLLNPAVAFLERIKLPRGLAILFVMLALVGLLFVVGWRTSQQFVDLSDAIPTYKQTLDEKIHSLKGSGGQSFNKATDTVRELGKEIGAVAPGATAAIDARKGGAVLGSSPTRPMAVQVVPSSNPFESMQTLLGPLVNGGLVVVFTIFILAGREDLRDRFIRLAGGSRLHLMTQAMDDAARRINRYLFLQLLVNSIFGVVIGIALQFLGVPNGALWGVGAAILRFLPYIGPPLAALMPILLALAIFPGWHHALLVAGLFFALELLVSNIIEPLLYGAHIGLSPLAILVAAVFWTLIWGFPGLVLSTPLTVCLVVMGRHVPSLSFLNVLLGDEPTLSPHAQYYQRLLASDPDEARKILEVYLKNKTLQELYSAVLIPALALAEHDRHRNVLDEPTQTFIYETTKELIQELGTTPIAGESETPDGAGTVDRAQSKSPGKRLEIVCVPARDNADELVAILLSQLLERQGHKTQSITIDTIDHMLSQIASLRPQLVVLSALPPFAVSHAASLYRRLHAQAPDVPIVVCLWQFEGDPAKAKARLELLPGHGFFTTLPDVLEHSEFFAQENCPPAGPLQP